MASDQIDAIDEVTRAVRTLCALLRGADNVSDERDRGWLIEMAINATKEANAAVDRLNA
jgi:hypothetical protein